MSLKLSILLSLLSPIMVSFATAETGAGGSADKKCLDRAGMLARRLTLTDEIDEIKKAERVSDRLRRKEAYSYDERPKSKVIEMNFEKNLEQRRALFREYFWSAGRFPDQMDLFWKKVSAIPPRRLRLLRQKTVNAIGAIFKSGVYPVYWQTDGVLKIDKMRGITKPRSARGSSSARSGARSQSVDIGVGKQTLGQRRSAKSLLQSGGDRRGARSAVSAGGRNKAGVESVPTVEVALEFSPRFMKKHANELNERAQSSLKEALELEKKRLGRELNPAEKKKIMDHHNRFAHRALSKQELTEYERRWNQYIELPQQWLEKYTSIHKDVNDMVDEISSRTFQAARIRHHMKRDGFYIDDLPYGTDRDDHVITIIWYEGGVKKTMNKAFQNKRSAISFLEEFERPIKELRGGLLGPRGKLADRIIEQALLRERLGILRREISFFLNNQEGSHAFKTVYTKEELSELTRFYDSLEKALGKTVHTLVNKSEPVLMSTPDLSYDVSDRALRKVRMRQINSELSYVLGYDILNFLGNIVGAPLRGIGRKTGWHGLENAGDALSNAKPEQLKQFRKRLNDSVEANALKRRIEETMNPAKRVYRLGLKTVAPGGLLAVFAGDDIADFALDTSSSLFHKFWGSKWACVNAELEDLGTYENLVEGK
ncbi:MAG: hypothetical protein OXB88_04210, partial [Bacteriovoracales bacterium]|nr:hypothetical protein [Bacteriovoracales bacterium]